MADAIVRRDPRYGAWRGGFLAVYGNGQRSSLSARWQVVPVPRNEWRQVAAEDQFEAALYLGPPSSIVASTWTRELCVDAAYMKMRMERSVPRFRNESVPDSRSPVLTGRLSTGDREPRTKDQGRTRDDERTKA